MSPCKAKCVGMGHWADTEQKGRNKFFLWLRTKQPYLLTLNADFFPARSLPPLGFLPRYL
jgi:hypothetical protein